MANKIASILANNPPWPGKIDPVSLILAFLLKNEINKSPSWDINEINKQTENISGNPLVLIWNSLIFVNFCIYKKIIIGINENTKDPKVPDIVLLGLILVNFLSPIVLPTTYPPISEKIQTL